MRRHPALHRLTEDHHHALVHLRRLRQADARTIRARVQQFLTAWQDEVQPHFREEEMALLPCVCPPIGPDRGPIPVMCAQHIRIRRAVMELRRAHLAGDEEQCLAAAAAVAEALEEHVRHEEREVFEAVQETLDEVRMAALGEYLSAWEAAVAESRALDAASRAQEEGPEG